MSTSRQPVSCQVGARTHVATADASHHAELQSGRPGGRFILTIEVWNGDHAWIGVHDQGGHWMHSQPGPGGRGLGIVGQLATHWDVRGYNTGRSIYARLDWPDSEQPP